MKGLVDKQPKGKQQLANGSPAPDRVNKSSASRNDNINSKKDNRNPEQNSHIKDNQGGSRK